MNLVKYEFAHLLSQPQESVEDDGKMAIFNAKFIAEIENNTQPSFGHRGKHAAEYRP